ncbi:MAG: hypothetical protein KAI29_27280 [Cyclobacteriaceae bacterium]|nr:hypothetical protein [Cyclobacteriaceae bacterium]
MKNYFLIVIIFSLLVLSCKEEDVVVCYETNPLEELEWLKTEIEYLNQADSATAKYFYVSQAEYKDSTIFIIANCCPFCYTIMYAYNCSGEIVGNLGYGDDDIDIHILENATVIWRHDDSGCLLEG